MAQANSIPDPPRAAAIGGNAMPKALNSPDTVSGVGQAGQPRPQTVTSAFSDINSEYC